MRAVEGQERTSLVEKQTVNEMTISVRSLLVLADKERTDTRSTRSTYTVVSPALFPMPLSVSQTPPAVVPDKEANK